MSGSSSFIGQPWAVREISLINPSDRAWLLHFCALLSRDSDAAEDLAQETLIEAWRHADRLRDPSEVRPWLTGIARNVHRRWARQQARQARRTLPTRQDSGGLIDQIPDDDAFDYEAKLDRKELATLLDRALGLLPVETRDLLIQHYIEESSHAEIAERLGLSKGTLSVRLHRGRLMLRRVLVDTMAEELAASGIVVPDDAGWHQTSLWCRYCGTRRLLGRMDADGVLTLRCPGCCRTPEESHTEHLLPESYRSTKGFKTLYRRSLELTHLEMTQALSGELGRCPICGAPLQTQIGRISGRPLVDGHWGITRACPNPRCSFHSAGGTFRVMTTLATVNLASPEGRRFWRDHSHLLALPEREIEHRGAPALVVSFQDMESPARLDVISHRTTFAMLGIYHVHSA